MIHVYAVTDCAVLPRSLTGIDGAAVELIAHHGVFAAVTRHSKGPPVSVDAAVSHGRVCDALLDGGCTVLPVRFGARYRDLDALTASIEQRAGALAANLVRLRGHVEVGVRAMWAGPAVASRMARPASATAPVTGTEYLMRRVDAEHASAERRAAAEEIARDVDESLRPLAIAAHQDVAVSAETALVAAYLIRRDDVRSFVAAAAGLDEARADVRVVCTGPWPPYHFADGETR